MRNKNSRTKAFTLIEVLVVIVVIGILAGVSLVIYNGINIRAERALRETELKQVRDIFEVYGVRYDKYPEMPDGQYCIGTGFPDTNGDGIGDCRDINVPSLRRSENATLNQELRKVADNLEFESVKKNHDITTNIVGPYVHYGFENEYITVNHIFPGSEPCPKGTFMGWENDAKNVRVCAIKLK